MINQMSRFLTKKRINIITLFAIVCLGFFVGMRMKAGDIKKRNNQLISTRLFYFTKI